MNKALKVRLASIADPIARGDALLAHEHALNAAVTRYEQSRDEIVGLGYTEGTPYLEYAEPSYRILSVDEPHPEEGAIGFFHGPKPNAKHWIVPIVDEHPDELKDFPIKVELSEFLSRRDSVVARLADYFQLYVDEVSDPVRACIQLPSPPPIAVLGPVTDLKFPRQHLWCTQERLYAETLRDCARRWEEHVSEIRSIVTRKIRILKQILGLAATDGMSPGTGQSQRYVTLDQMAAAVQRSKRTLEKLANRRNGPFPPPDIPGGGGRAHEWEWSKVRPVLEKEYRRDLPNIFHSFRPDPQRPPS